MLVGADIHGKGFKIGAATLSDEQLAVQYESHFVWILQERDDVTRSKFSIDMAWFRECWWEMVRRRLVMVN